MSGGGSKKVHSSCGTGKARAVDGMGRSGEEEDLLERAVGDEGIQGKLYHQGCLRCPTFSRKPKPMVCQRPHVPKSSNTEAHLIPLFHQKEPGAGSELVLVLVPLANLLRNGSPFHRLESHHSAESDVTVYVSCYTATLAQQRQTQTMADVALLLILMAL
ncbi:uncharacterized [Tachysurus ichikawai]